MKKLTQYWSVISQLGHKLSESGELGPPSPKT